MKELQINQKNLEIFIDNICKSDKEELVFHFGKRYKKIFIDLILKDTKGTILLGNNKNIPIAIGGVNEKDKNAGIIWLICTKEYKNHQKELYKYVKNKIKTYKEKYDMLFNFIYKSNFKAQMWLEKFGFQFHKTNNENLKLFHTTKKGHYFDIRNFTGK